MKKMLKKVRRRHAIEVFTYLCVGASAWVVQTIVYLLAMKMRVFPSVSMILGNCSGFVIAYFGHVRFTFKRTHRFSHTEFVKFLVTSIIGLCINVSGVRIITKVFMLHPGYGIIPTVFTPGITFLISKLWAFK